MFSKEKKGFLEFVYDFYKGMHTHEITLAYEGEMNHQVMKAFAELTIGKMAKQSETSLVQKKVFYVMVECLQNITKHAFHTNFNNGNEYNHGILLITNTKDSYQITTGNEIEENKINNLKEFLEKINSLEKPELDILYKKQLKEGSLSNKGGAGLGFIDIKRKTGENLEFHFLPVNDTHSFFLFTSTIPRNIKH